MFLVSPAISTKYQIGEKEQFGFSGSSLDQLWDVFASSTVDDSLRESAAEQLSVLVQGIYISTSILFVYFLHFCFENAFCNDTQA